MSLVYSDAWNYLHSFVFWGHKYDKEKDLYSLFLFQTVSVYLQMFLRGKKPKVKRFSTLPDRYNQNLNATF